MIRLEILAQYTSRYTVPRGFLGLAVRGALGYSLRRMTCVYVDYECSKCPNYRSCPYAILYESTPLVNPASNIATKSEGVTNPMTVEVMYSSRRGISFAVNLFGRAVKYRKEVIISLFTLSLLGLGYDPLRAERRKVALKRIVEINPFLGRAKEIYDGKNLKVNNVSNRVEKSILASFATQARSMVDARPTHLEIRFFSPYRLGNGIYKPTFRQLMMNIARRYSLIAEYHNAGKSLSKVDARHIAWLSNRVKLEGYEIPGLIEVTKRSAVTGEKISYGKFARKGILTYSLPEDFWDNPYAPVVAALLLAGQYIHVGKLATGGYGAYRLRYFV